MQINIQQNAGDNMTPNSDSRHVVALSAKCRLRVGNFLKV